MQVQDEGLITLKGRIVDIKECEQGYKISLDHVYALDDDPEVCNVLNPFVMFETIVSCIDNLKIGDELEWDVGY